MCVPASRSRAGCEGRKGTEKCAGDSGDARTLSADGWAAGPGAAAAVDSACQRPSLRDFRHRAQAHVRYGRRPRRGAAKCPRPGSKGRIRGREGRDYTGREDTVSGRGRASEARPEPVFADGPPCHPRRSEAEIGDGERCPSIPPGSCVSGYPGDRSGQTARRPPVPRIADASGGATLTPSRVPDLRFAASGMTRGGLRFAALGVTRGDLRFAASGMTRGVLRFAASGMTKGRSPLRCVGDDKGRSPLRCVGDGKGRTGECPTSISVADLQRPLPRCVRLL